MSQNGRDCLCFESFLQKRKDTLKLLWMKYWFRLQNTTLFFYTQKHGNASHLRGHYYIYKVQSVREVLTDDSKRFIFEIIMTSGKRKMLAADSAALRKDWLRYLWQAMHLSTSGAVTVHSVNREVSNQQSIHSNIYSDVECVVKNNDLPLPPVPEPTLEEPVYQNTAFQPPTEGAGAEGPIKVNEAVYDVLPSRENLQEAEPSTDTNDGVYDTPISYRKPADPEHTENPYDVPSALLRKMSVSSTDPEEWALMENFIGKPSTVLH